MARFEPHETAFPRLTHAHFAQLGSCTAATPSTHATGDVLAHVGDREPQVLRRAVEIEILDLAGDAPATFAVHGRGEFTGDVSHPTGRRRLSPPPLSATARSMRLAAIGSSRSSCEPDPRWSDPIRAQYVKET